MAGYDPLRPARGSANLGSAALGRGGEHRWELADVVIYNSATHTAVIRTHSGRPLRDVPQIKLGAGEFEHLRTGTTVVVTYDLGIPAILGVIDFVGAPQNSIPSPSMTGVDGIGDDNPLLPTEGLNSFKPPGAPTDMTPGDWARVSTLGNGLGVYEGGVTTLGAPTSQVRSMALSGLLQFIARSMHTVTDFGEWKVTNEQGGTSWVLNAGASQTTETGLDEEHWAIRIALGAAGNIFDFRITEPNGKTAFQFHVTPDGRVKIYGDGGVDISSGKAGDAETRHDVEGDHNTAVGQNTNLTIGGQRATMVGNNDTETVGEDKYSMVGASETKVVNANRTTSVGGKKTEVVIGGAPSAAQPGGLAVETRLVNGGWLVDIGNPSDGANISAQAAYRLRTSAGNIEHDAGGAMYLKAAQNVSVKGATIELNGVDQHAARGDDVRETFNGLVAFVNKLARFVYTHAHQGGGPSTPTTPPLNPLIPVNPPVNPSGIPLPFFPGIPAFGPEDYPEMPESDLSSTVFLK